MEVAGELRRRQVGGDVWWPPYRDGSPKDAGGLGACTGASRNYDARDSGLFLASSPRRPKDDQITAATLYNLQHPAYDRYCLREADGAEDQPEFEDWCHHRENISQFQYWATVLELEVLVLGLRAFSAAGIIHNVPRRPDGTSPRLDAFDRTNYASSTANNSRCGNYAQWPGDQSSESFCTRLTSDTNGQNNPIRTKQRAVYPCFLT